MSSLNVSFNAVTIANVIWGFATASDCLYPRKAYFTIFVLNKDLSETDQGFFIYYLKSARKFYYPEMLSSFQGLKQSQTAF